ncbi:MAG: ShlB/FhaC/HecB family hemolysin secretion/activation protein [Oceanospirillaceae bacterium]|nr:ShlB/FhaC/HecB family hemolysin secretion/activation protein [Oceanospirillaceae bacterium]
MKTSKELKSLSLAAGGLIAVSMAINANATPTPVWLPDAATAGGLQHIIEVPILEPVEPTQLIIPSRIEREESEDDGPQITIDNFQLLEQLPGGQFIQVQDKKVLGVISAIKAERENQFTLNALQLLADEITNHYREQGAILATVYLPAQDVTGNTVKFHLLAGVLESVEPDGETKFSDMQLRRPFLSQLGKTVQKNAIESGLLTLLDFPGLDVSGVLEAGESVGSSKMVLSVEDGQKVQGSVYVDNQGSRYTGEIGLGASLSINNPFGLIDRLTLNAAIQNKPTTEGDKSVSPSYSGGISYTFRPFDPNYIFNIGYNSNKYEIGRELTELGFAGQTQSLTASVRKQLLRSRVSNSYVEAGFELKSSETTRDESVQSHDKLTNINVSIGYDHSDSLAGGGFSQGSMKLVKGLENTLGSRSNDDSEISRISLSGVAPVDFSKFQFNLARYQKITKNLNVAVKLQGQYSRDALVSIEQFGLGGANSVRAYSGAEYMADSAYYIGVEFITRAPGFADKAAFNDRTWGEVLQLSLFVDYAKGHKNDALANEIEDIELSGIGVGVRIMPAEGMVLDMSVAKPLGKIAAGNERDPQFFAKFKYDY